MMKNWGVGSARWVLLCPYNLSEHRLLVQKILLAILNGCRIVAGRIIRFILDIGTDGTCGTSGSMIRFVWVSRLPMATCGCSIFVSTNFKFSVSLKTLHTFNLILS